eukprot:TRINITY_DN4263_c3_g1_i1.p1 TRINITY_DN4263_c3_g1~~TRINITY_DN4263_c3_g1_i1.p1  ORF type:complete len:448 (-),score=71.73 TRINITY_DN4263_c3_g1_i1:117-1439(-)
MALDAHLWKRLSPSCYEEEQPEERWEDGDLNCGIRGAHDFRPAVDPTFLDLSSLVLVLFDTSNNSNNSLHGHGGLTTPLLAWSLRLYAPCAWMLPKKPLVLQQLDHLSAFRHESTVAAFTLGRQQERPICYTLLESLLHLGARESSVGAHEGDWVGGATTCGDADSQRTGRRKKGQKQRKATTMPRDLRSGKNPNGLNLFVPRRKVSDGDSIAVPDSASVRRPAKSSALSCDVEDVELSDFIRKHPASLREAEQLCVRLGCSDAQIDPTLIDADIIDGLIEDAAKLEMRHALSQDSIVELAKKWKILNGKWLLFVPEWRIDDLFASAALRLRDGNMGNCIKLVVSPPGTYGTDPTRFMLSAHCCDFTDARSVMAVGKCLRAVARNGLRSASGDWGELQDDPFAAPGKKVSLVFKPEVFTRLNLHKNNPYGIKTTLYFLSL